MSMNFEDMWSKLLLVQSVHKIDKSITRTKRFHFYITLNSQACTYMKSRRVVEQWKSIFSKRWRWSSLSHRCKKVRDKVLNLSIIAKLPIFKLIIPSSSPGTVPVVPLVSFMPTFIVWLRRVCMLQEISYFRHLF